MTVCIASICGPVADAPAKTIVAVADMKASQIQGSNEMASTKGIWILPGWLALLAGDDISPCIPICDEVRRMVTGKQNTVEHITTSFSSAYKNHLSNLATDKVLGRWKLTIEEFEDSGRKKFGQDNFDVLFSQIMEVRLRCQFLVCGFDHGGVPHIFTIRNPGIAENYDTPGYYAIGDGAGAAISILGFFQQNVITSVPRTYYNVFAAKYMAESSTSSVGRSTFAWELGPDGSRGTSNQIFPLFQITRDAWKIGKPSMPEGVEERIRQARYATTQSELEKSESGQ